ncbi:UDP-glycosyltransferase 708G1 [Linum grandiflorum]
MSTSDDHRPHVALLPSSGAGHLIPFLRLAATLLAKNVRVTLITSHPIVTAAESSLISHFLAAFPQVSEQKFHILPIDSSTANSTDPFFLQWESIRRSLHIQLTSILSSISPPPAALVSDVTLISSTISVTQKLKIPNYILSTSSVRMLSFITRYPLFTRTEIESAETFHIPGIGDVPRSSVPPLLLKPESLFATIFKSNSENLGKFDGILVNTFEKLESQAMSAVRKLGLPDLFNVGLIPHEFERKSSVGGGRTEEVMKWLDGKEPKSVVYVSFGSRTALSRDQIKELGKGLVESGFWFIWVMKDKMVDKEDGERLEDVLGEEMMKEVGERGLVVKDWVDQVEVIRHESVGGFVSHCGWNSVVEAAWAGVPVLAWPLHGDQRINGEVVEMCGLGFVGGGNWGLGLVKGGEIGVKIKELMEDEKVRELAKGIRVDVKGDVGVGGKCDVGLNLLVEKWAS